jgi:mRNA-degrading endonuclease RelE of RelBE toxin-antitoxin system
LALAFRKFYGKIRKITRHFWAKLIKNKNIKNLMEKYQLKQTEEFRKEFEKLPSEIRQRFEKQIKKVEVNPYGIGDPLRYRWFRELKNKKFRLYYVIFDKEVVILFVGVSDKKSQQKIIDLVIKDMDKFKGVAGK